MVTTMMLRMVLYAPIVGIGGIIKVAQTKSGMEWVIAIAVAAIMVLFSHWLALLCQSSRLCRVL